MKILLLVVFMMASCAKTPVMTSPEEPAQVSPPQAQEEVAQDEDGVPFPTPTPRPHKVLWVPHGS